MLSLLNIFTPKMKHLTQMIQALPAVQTLTDIALYFSNVILKDADEDDESTAMNANMVSFIREKFQKKVCSNFIPIEALPSEEDGYGFSDSQEHEERVLCVCGSLLKDHPNNAAMYDTDGPQIFVEELKPTDAFGQIRFYPKSVGYRKPAQYVRMIDTTDPELVLELLCNHWNLNEPVPSLVVSVAGAGNLSCLSDTQTREIFNRGLIKAIRATHGWLITFGLNSGVAKSVGEAVQEGQSLEFLQTSDDDSETQRSLHCIGIAAWNEVQNKDFLTNKRPDRINYVDYYVDQVARDGEPVSLNPNHSNFLIVDTGVSNDSCYETSGGTAEFRAALERQIAAPKEEGGLDVPVICLLVEGDLTSLEQLLNSVKQGLPAVICEKSGKAADLLAWTMKQYSRIREIHDQFLFEKEEYQLRSLVIHRMKEQDSEQKLPEITREQIADIVIEICGYYEQITLFQIGPNSSLDEALLLSILDSQHRRDPWKQLELAQKWNRADVAQRILSDPRFSIMATKSNVQKLMGRLTESLVANQVDFVTLYIDAGLPVKDYLTAAKLTEIYKKTAKEAPYLWKRFGISSASTSVSIRKLDFMLKLGRMTLSNVNLLIRSFGRRFVQPEYEESNCPPNKRHFAAPLQELFYWAVLLNRQDLAEYFWEKSEAPLITAIAGTVLCHYLSTERGDELHASLRQNFAQFKNKLEVLAVGLTNEAFQQNVNKAVLMIQRPSMVWGRLTCMALAGLAHDQVFLSTECCQYAIKKTWKRGFSANTWQIVVSMITFFPVTTIIQFEKELPRHCRCPTGLCSCKRKLFMRPKTKKISLAHPVYDERPELLSLTSMVRATRSPSEEFFPQFPSDFDDEITRIDLRTLVKIWLKKMFTFYYSPVVKFVNSTIFYALYLLLYSYVMLFSLGHGEGMSFSEKFLYFWQLTFICEEIRIILWHPGDTLKDKLADWWIFSTLQTWNRLHVAGYSLSLIIFLMRIFVEKAFAITKLLLLVNLLVYILRIFKVYFINEYLGPKVVMIKRMTRDLVMFLLVFCVFMVSYSVAYHTFYEPRTKFEPSVLPLILTHGIWEIFGEVNSEALDPRNSTPWYCKDQESQNHYITECNLRHFPMIVLLAIYLFFSNILLVNMLIATFTHIFDEIHKNSKQIWKFEMYFLMEEFRTKPLFAEPFIILEHIYLLIRHLIQRCHGQPAQYTQTDEIIWGKVLSKQERHFLSVFESVCRADFVENRMKRCCLCTCGRCCKCASTVEKRV